MAGEDLEERLGKLEQNIGKITSLLEGTGGESDDDDSGGKNNMKSLDSFSDAELEQMSRRDVIQLIMGSVQQGFKEIQKNVNEAITDTRSEVSTANIRQELRDAAGKHPEIAYLKDELRAMIEEHPDLSVERMINLIKVEQPSKYEEAVKKHTEESSGKKEGKEGEDGKEGDEKEGGDKKDPTKEDQKEGADKDGKGGDQKKGSGGLPPGGAGGGSGAADSSAEGKQSAKEAANSAFNELFGEKDQL